LQGLAAVVCDSVHDSADGHAGGDS
jgi:hypothetical protein